MNCCAPTKATFDRLIVVTIRRPRRVAKQRSQLLPGRVDRGELAVVGPAEPGGGNGLSRWAIRAQRRHRAVVVEQIRLVVGRVVVGQRPI